MHLRTIQRYHSSVTSNYISKHVTTLHSVYLYCVKQRSFTALYLIQKTFKENRGKLPWITTSVLTKYLSETYYDQRTDAIPI